MRFFGWLFLLVGVAALIWDAVAWGGSGPFRFQAFGEIWSKLHRDSLLLIQPAIERHINEDLYLSVVQPVLLTPAAPLFGVLGVFLIGLSALLWRRR